MVPLPPRSHSFLSPPVFASSPCRIETDPLTFSPLLAPFFVSRRLNLSLQRFEQRPSYRRFEFLMLQSRFDLPPPSDFPTSFFFFSPPPRFFFLSIHPSFLIKSFRFFFVCTSLGTPSTFSLLPPDLVNLTGDVGSLLFFSVPVQKHCLVPFVRTALQLLPSLSKAGRLQREAGSLPVRPHRPVDAEPFF